MKVDLVNEASKLIPHLPTLINIVSQRVRQLKQGRAPLVDLAGRHRLGQADIALLEIIEGKVVIGEPDDSDFVVEPGAPPCCEAAAPFSHAWHTNPQIRQMSQAMKKARQAASSASREVFLAQLKRQGRILVKPITK